MDRRGFLKLLGLGAGAVAVPAAPTVLDQPAPVTTIVKARAWVPWSQELIDDGIAFQSALTAVLERSAWLAQQFAGLDRHLNHVEWRKRELQLGMGLGRTTPMVRLP